MNTPTTPSLPLIGCPDAPPVRGTIAPIARKKPAIVLSEYGKRRMKQALDLLASVPGLPQIMLRSAHEVSQLRGPNKKAEHGAGPGSCVENSGGGGGVEPKTAVKKQPRKRKAIPA